MGFDLTGLSKKKKKYFISYEAPNFMPHINYH